MRESDPIAAKARLRRRLRAARRDLDPQDRRRETARVVAAARAEAEGRPLVAYCAAGSELDPAALVQERWSAGEAVWLPRVDGGDLVWHPVHDVGDLRRGYRGISEPDPARCPAADPPAACAVLVPGLGFTAAGERLGQGGGFYDRALPRLRARGGRLIGLAFACQLCGELPLEAHDLVLDRVCWGGTG